jgi:alpha-tubulin suppressor-like RCC1 family protein
MIPIDILGMESSVAIVAPGGAHACAMMTDGTVGCWGYNQYGQLGNGTTSQGNTETPVTVNGLDLTP